MIARAHERSEAQHPALRLRRGSGRHRARGAAPAPERAAGRRARRRSPTCRSWSPRWCACSEQFPQCNALLRRRAQRARASPRRARRRRDADAGRPQGAGRAARRGARRCTISPPRSAASPRPRAPTRRPREELTGSTITVTSLGKLGGIASTPIINAPEVAIIGVNKAVERPVVIDGAIAMRLMMNLSSSFDHRFVDGFDAAAMIQALKEMLEHPGHHLHSGIDAHERSDCRITLEDNDDDPASAAARPGLRHRARRARWRLRISRTGAGASTSSRKYGADSRCHPAVARACTTRSTCFEGFKAYRWARRQHAMSSAWTATSSACDRARGCSRCRAGRRAARGDGHRRSSIACRDQVPEPPGALYLRPLAVRHDAEHRRGVDADDRGDADRAREPGLGLLRGRHEAAADLRRGQGQRARRRTSGMVKAGGNYAAAMGPTLAAREQVQGRPGRCSARAARCRRPAPRTSC